MPVVGEAVRSIQEQQINYQPAAVVVVVVVRLASLSRGSQTDRHRLGFAVAAAVIVIAVEN